MGSELIDGNQNSCSVDECGSLSVSKKQHFLIANCYQMGQLLLINMHLIQLFRWQNVAYWNWQQFLQSKTLLLMTCLTMSLICDEPIRCDQHAVWKENNYMYFFYDPVIENYEPQATSK